MKIPGIIYGTAWKKEKTARLVVQAIQAGFRGIDTAGQPKHYHEAGVGEALEKLRELGIPREQLFIQTKFTPLSGHDPARIPYDPNASLTEQVNQSFASSLKNLSTNYVDSLVLHSPLSNWKQLTEVWQAMEAIHEKGTARRIGISNCYDLSVLETLHDEAQVKPAVVQNRFYADTDYDVEIRAFCKEHGITYQSFWTLTANPHILGSAEIDDIARTHDKTPEQVFFRFVTQIGITPLTGTQSLQHMKEDLGIFEFELSKIEIDRIAAQMELAQPLNRS